MEADEKEVAKVNEATKPGSYKNDFIESGGFISFACVLATVCIMYYQGKIVPSELLMILGMIGTGLGIYKK